MPAPGGRLAAGPRGVRASRASSAGVVHAAGRALAARVPGSCGPERRCSRPAATPELITEITLQPVRRHGVDAAILFSDIVVPLVGGRRRRRHRPRRRPGRREADPHGERPRRLRAARPERRPVSSPRPCRRSSPSSGATPLIGFAGAPFTLASYLVEGGPSRDHARTKALMHGDPTLWHALLARLAVIAREFLRVQVDAGAAAVQLFDSWAGALSRADYERFVLPHSRAVLEPLAGWRAAHPLRGRDGRAARARCAPPAPTSSASTGGCRWTRPRGGSARAPWCRATSTRRCCSRTGRWSSARCVASSAEGHWRAAGHIFNLGHGVLPETDPDVLTRVVELVQALDRLTWMS